MKKVAMLGIVGILTACGSGYKWTETTFEEFAAKNEEYMIKVEENLATVKMSGKAHEIHEESISGTLYTYQEYKTDYRIDAVAKKARLAVEYKYKKTYDNDSASNTEGTKTVDCYVVYDEEKGVIMTNPKEKQYIVYYPNEVIGNFQTLFGLDKDKTIGTLISSTIIESVEDSAIFTGDFPALISAGGAEGYFLAYATDSLKQNYYFGKGTSLKVTISAKDHYDDEYTDGYDVDYTLKFNSEMKDCIVTNYLCDYKETGKYYNSVTEKVDYKYRTYSEAKGKKGASIKVPSYKDYEELVIS